MNGKEIETIEELQQRMQDVLTVEMLKDNHLFYRFLKARDFDIHKAEIMLRKHIIWRKAFKVDTIVEEFVPSETFLKYIQGVHLGVDKKGNAVRYMPFGNIDVRDIVHCFKIHDYLRHLIWMVEKDLSLSEEKKNSAKFTQIIDCDKLQFSNVVNPASADICFRILHMYQDHYPERLNEYFVINAPEFHVILYSMLKKFLALEVRKKIHIFGKAGWKEELLKAIDADVLPAFLGGNKTDPDGNPMCNTFVPHGGRIPSKFYLSKEDRSFMDRSQVKQITISPRKRYEVFLEIKSIKSIIQWQYQVQDKDIGFGLFFKENENKLNEILPIYRFDTPDGVEIGSHRCQRIGSYVVVFDNTFSRFKSKEVSYCIRVSESPE